MKTESKNKQEKYILEPLENGRVRVTLYANQTPVARADGTHYLYDKYVIDTISRPKLEQYITISFDAWISNSATAEYNELAESARIERNELLAESDNTMFPDRTGIDIPAWTAYRQALRDITKQSGFPYEINWPKKPE